MSRRILQMTLIASTLGLSWLGMQIVHELGHILCAWAGGERILGVILQPLSLSRTDTTHDHHPLLVIWGGPVVGTLLPLGTLGVLKLTRSRLVYLFRFFSGFCLVVNGAYIGVGGFSSVGDAGDLLRYGAPLWTLVAFGLVGVPLGLWLWNGIGPHFGLGPSNGEVDRRCSLGILLLFLTVVAVEIVFGLSIVPNAETSP